MIEKMLNYFRYVDTPSLILKGLMVIVLLSLTLVLVDQVWLSEPIYYTAEVKDGLFKPNTFNTTVNPIINSNGNLGIAVVTSGSDESFNIVVKDLRNGEIYSIETTAEVLYNLSIDDHIKVAEQFGKIFGTIKRSVVTQGD